MKEYKKLFRLVTVSFVLCFVLTGCGDSKKDSTSGNNKPTSEDNMMDDVGNAVEDAADGVGNAVEDVADGVGNAVNDLVGNDGFDNYKDAHSYFLDTMSSYHADAKFELREENEKLMDYQEGSKGYRFKLYDTSKNKEGDLFGEFYVDATSGMIYKKGNNNSFVKYPENSKDVNTKADMKK